MKRRVLFVGRTRYQLPLNESLTRKFDSLEDVFDLRVLASLGAGSANGDPTFALVRPSRVGPVDGVLWYLLLPARVAREVHRFRPDAIIVESPYEGAAVVLARVLTPRRPRLILEVHGDWRTATRLYGSPLRRLLSPVADRVAAWAIRRADAVRPVSDFTGNLVRRLGVEPADVFPAFIDVGPFIGTPPLPLPDRPTALFIGVLELYKNIDGLAEAWRLAAPRVPQARLRLVGDGSRRDVVERLLADLPEQTSWTPALSTAEVATALDEANVLVLPSRSEGLGRVIVEALSRGRPVVASWSGGTPDVIRDGVNGILVQPGDTRTLADVLVRVLSDRELVERMAAAARESAEPFLAEPPEYAARISSLVERLSDPAAATP